MSQLLPTLQSNDGEMKLTGVCDTKINNFATTTTMQQHTMIQKTNCYAKIGNYDATTANCDATVANCNVKKQIITMQQQHYEAKKFIVMQRLAM